MKKMANKPRQTQNSNKMNKNNPTNATEEVEQSATTTTTEEDKQSATTTTREGKQDKQKNLEVTPKPQPYESDIIKKIVATIEEETREEVEKVNTKKLRALLPDFMLAWRTEQDKIKSLTETVEVLVKRVEVLERAQNKTKKIQKNREIKEKDNCLLFKGIQTEEEEDPAQTTADFLELLEINDVQVVATEKLQQKPRKSTPEAAPKKMPPTLRVRLANPKDKFKIYGAVARLAKAKGLQGEPKFGKIQITQEYPAFLRKQLEELEKKAYDLRQNTKCKTRIRLVGSELALFKRASDAQDFVKI